MGIKNGLDVRRYLTRIDTEDPTEVLVQETAKFRVGGPSYLRFELGWALRRLDEETSRLKTLQGLLASQIERGEPSGFTIGDIAKCVNEIQLMSVRYATLLDLLRK